MGSGSGIVTRTEGPAGYILLDRPRRANAYRDATLEALSRALAAHVEAEGVRVVVVGSAVPGRFSSGADLDELGHRSGEDALRLLSRELFDRLAECPKPTIAAIDGPAIAGGLELALACDLRLASNRARFALPETALGLIPAAGATWRLPRLVGDAVARRMILFGDELDAEEALRVGLVSEVVAPEELADRVQCSAERAARLDPLALRLAKQALAAPTEGGARELTRSGQAVLYERRHRGGPQDGGGAR
jgi:enoyl-CoA hydratase/carnithine racemase